MRKPLPRNFNCCPGTARCSPRISSHLFGGGYEANFYSYQWSQIMEADAFAAFAEKGLYDRGLAKDYKNILTHGGSEWAIKLFREFRHRNPLDKFMLDRAGLLKEHFSYAADPQQAQPAPEAAPGVVQDSALQAAFGAGKFTGPGHRGPARRNYKRSRPRQREPQGRGRA